MKVIEREMVAAVRARRDWHRSNTKVVIGGEGDAGKAFVYLFDKHIATVDEEGVHVNERTLIAWPTVTTRSRLRALGVNVWQAGGEQYLDGVKL